MCGVAAAEALIAVAFALSGPWLVITAATRARHTLISGDLWLSVGFLLVIPVRSLALSATVGRVQGDLL